jgi:membrane fusion protein, multidrug efflux system
MRFIRIWRFLASRRDRPIGFAAPAGRCLASVGLCLLLTLAACEEKKQASAPPPKPAVGVRPVVTKGVSQSFEFVGHVKAINQVDVRARVEGFLDKVLFAEGQDVKAGDLLYQIEKIQFQALVDQARANVVAAEAQTLNSSLQYGRESTLAKDQWRPQSVVDQTKAGLDSNRAKVMQTRAALTQAEVNLGYTDIRSPIDGRIGRTVYTLGNLVNPASGILVTIVSQDPMYVLFPVSVRDLELIRAARGQTDGNLSKIEVRLRLPSGDEYSERGVWNLTDPQVDQQTDSLVIRAVFPNPQRRLIDGQFVTAEIRERREQPRLAVPQVALQVDQSGYFALVVDAEHKVEQRRVRTGPALGLNVVVAAGLNEGDNVIVDGIQKVRPGQVVQETVVPEMADAK